MIESLDLDNLITGCINQKITALAIRYANTKSIKTLFQTNRLFECIY